MVRKLFKCCDTNMAAVMPSSIKLTPQTTVEMSLCMKIEYRAVHCLGLDQHTKIGEGCH